MKELPGFNHKWNEKRNKILFILNIAAVPLWISWIAFDYMFANDFWQDIVPYRIGGSVISIIFIIVLSTKRKIIDAGILQVFMYSYYMVSMVIMFSIIHLNSYPIYFNGFSMIVILILFLFVINFKEWLWLIAITLFSLIAIFYVSPYKTTEVLGEGGFVTSTIVLLMITISLMRYKANVKDIKTQLLLENSYIEIKSKNKEITDSINYAKRIQEAILPSTQTVKKFLPNSFIFYKPKDIVAGDFYWVESSSPNLPKGKGVSPPSGESEGAIVLFAAADCTGHGVPGALVSVVCSNALNHSLKELNTINPAFILDRTREIVINQFSKNDDQVRDGMDIALCVLNKETLELQFAGANNSLHIVREGKMLEYAAHREPVGRHHRETSFIFHTIQLQKDDTIYLFTDGYPDQFGGENGKKLKYKPFKELLLTISNYPVGEQKAFLNKHFAEWKGDYEQVDDVCVIGVRF